MSGDTRPFGTAMHRLRGRLARHRVPSDRPHILRRMDAADYLSLAALLWAWVAAVLFVGGEPNWGILAMLAAFGFDKLDGYWARSRGLTSRLGLRIDSYVDVLTYLLTGALLYHVALAPHLAASVAVGFALLGFGGLRLLRHAEEGFSEDDGTSYYRGITVVHVNVVLVACYFANALVGVPGGWLTAGVVVAASPLMISDYRCAKTTAGHALLGVVAALSTGLALALELGGL